MENDSIKQYVTNINGYYVKDAEAQESLSSINTSLENTYTKDEVDAIAETKANAGNSLSDYNINDAYTKTEVDNNISTGLSTLNITHFDTYNDSDMSLKTSTGITIRDNSLITVAYNDDKSIAKIYGKVYVYNTSSNDASNYVSIQTALRPESDITINCLGMRFALSTLASGNVVGGYNSDVKIFTTGEVRIPLATPSDWTDTWVQLTPCLLFIKDFGDTPIEE